MIIANEFKTGNIMDYEKKFLIKNIEAINDEFKLDNYDHIVNNYSLLFKLYPKYAYFYNKKGMR